MTSSVVALVFATSAVPWAAAQTSPAGPPSETVVHCGRLLKTATGVMRGESTILVEGDRVKEVRAGATDHAALERAATASGVRSGGSSAALRWAALISALGGEMAEDLLDDAGLGDERDDAHRLTAARAGERVNLIDARDELGPSAPESSPVGIGRHGRGG